MSATAALKQEHRVIEKMLKVLFAATQRLQAGEDVDPETLRKAVDFIRNFADRCHHGKEEDNLFPAMESRGVPKFGGPIGIMLVEHDEGRRHVRELAAALDKYEAGDRSPAVKSSIIAHARGYAQLLSQHIEKEDSILYMIADDVLSDTDQEDLLTIFDRIEEQTIGHGEHEEYARLPEELERALQRQAARA